MEEAFFVDRLFEKMPQQELVKGAYEACRFVNCDMAEMDLSGYHFIDCRFNDCNLSLAAINETVFRDVFFKDCKLLGLRFDRCSSFGRSFSFDQCILDQSSFFGVKIQKTGFIGCRMKGVDFADADLSQSCFKNTDLLEACFENTILSKVDFRSAYNYVIDPEQNLLKKAKFSVHNLHGLLYKYDLDIES